MYKFYLIVFLIIAIILIVLIMLQQDNGNSLGGFDSRMLGDMLNYGDFNNNVTRLIVILAVLFFLFSLLLGNLNSKSNNMFIENHDHELYQTHTQNTSNTNN